MKLVPTLPTIISAMLFALCLAVAQAGPALAADATNPAGSTISSWWGTVNDDNYYNLGTVTGSINMTQGGHDTVTNQGSVGFGIYGGSIATGNAFTNSGTVGNSLIGSDNSGASSIGGYNSIINSGTANTIYGSFNSGDDATGGDNTITNSGTVTSHIYGSYNGWYGTSGGGNIITNSGTVGGNITGSFQALGMSGGGNTINNSGTASNIYGSHNVKTGSSGGDNIITNSGTAGDIWASFNEGSNTSGGNNTITALSGSVTSSVTGSYNMGDGSSGGDNNITANSGSVIGSIRGSRNSGSNSSGGHNSITNNGTVRGITGSSNLGSGSSGGYNTIINTGAVSHWIVAHIYGSYNSGADSSGGSNTITNSGTVDNSILGSYNVGDSTSGGSNTIINSGTVGDYIIASYNITAGSSGGSNTITNSGTVTLDIYGSWNNGTSSSGGSNTITNSGTVTGNIYGSYNFGTGSSSTGNTITNSGTVGGSIYGSRNAGSGSSGGDDTITNSGTVGGSIYGADGNDRINLVGGSSVVGVVDGGSGTDTLGLSNMGTQDGSLWGTTYLNFENLVLYGGGTTLTGSWSVTGSTTVGSGGSFNVASGSSFGTDSFTVESGGEATINGALTANSTTNNGVMGVNGTLTSPTFTNNGFLGGTGTIVGDLTNTGTISPGNSIGTLHISGDFTNSSTGVLAVELGQGKGDCLAVSGTAFLNGGTLRASLTPGVYTDGTSWKVLTASSVVGSFAHLNFLIDSAVLSLAMHTGSKDVSLELSRKSYAEFAHSRNTRVIGSALDAIVPLAQHQGDAMAELITAMDFTYSAAQISDVLGQFNPEMYTAFTWAALQSTQTFSQTIAQQGNHYRDASPEERAQGTVLLAALDTGSDAGTRSAYTGGWSMWGRLLDAKANLDGSASNLGYGQDLNGVVLGGQGPVASWLDLGAALGFSRGDLSWDRPSYWGRMDNFHASLYGQARQGGWHGLATLVFSYHDAKAHRSLELAGNGYTATSDFHGMSGLAGLQGGYDFHLADWRVGPMAAARYTRSELNGFNESGADSWGLKVGDQSADSLQSALGLEASASWEVGGVRLRPRAQLAWWHEFNDDPYQVAASFLSYPAAPFTVDGLAQPADYLEAGVGLSAQMTNRLQAGVEISMALGDDYYAQSVALGVQYRF